MKTQMAAGKRCLTDEWEGKKEAGKGRGYVRASVKEGRGNSRMRCPLQALVVSPLVSISNSEQDYICGYINLEMEDMSFHRSDKNLRKQKHAHTN